MSPADPAADPHKSWRPPPPLGFLKPANICRRCGAGLTTPLTFTLCAACDRPGDAYEDAAGDRAAAATRLARRRFDVYAAVLAAAGAAGWVLYRHQRSARSLSLYLEYYRPDAARDPAAFRKVGKVATLLMDGAPRALTRGATHYHTKAVNPSWARRFPRTASIGAHLFYRQPTRSASN